MHAFVGNSILLSTESDSSYSRLFAFNWNAHDNSLPNAWPRNFVTWNPLRLMASPFVTFLLSYLDDYLIERRVDALIIPTTQWDAHKENTSNLQIQSYCVNYKGKRMALPLIAGYDVKCLSAQPLQRYIYWNTVYFEISSIFVGWRVVRLGIYDTENFLMMNRSHFRILSFVRQSHQLQCNSNYFKSNNQTSGQSGNLFWLAWIWISLNCHRVVVEIYPRKSTKYCIVYCIRM